MSRKRTTVRHQINFNLGDCISVMGLEPGGRVAEGVAEEIQRLSDDYIPFDEGYLKNKSGDISAELQEGVELTWDTPYAQYMWNGIVYEDPDLHCAGFKTDAGWRSREGVKKIPTNRKLTYRGESTRGPKWVNRMLDNGGREEIEKKAREEIKK